MIIIIEQRNITTNAINIKKLQACNLFLNMNQLERCFILITSTQARKKKKKTNKTSD